MNEEKVVTKKNNTWQIVCITLIVGLLIGIAGAYLFFSKNPKLITKTSVSTDVNEPEEDNEDEEIKTYKTTSIFIKKLIEKYDYYYISNTEVFDKFYSKEETKVTDLDANLIKILSAKEANRRLNTAYFTEKEFQDAKTMLFGNNIVVENGDFYLDGCGTAIKYYTESKTYSYYSDPGGGCGGSSGSSMVREITEVENKDDTLEVTVAAAIYDGINNKIYADTKFTQEITDVKISSDHTIAEADYAKLPKFRYYFSYDEENNNYYLATIKKINE